ncbi:MAG: hypothetical protein D6705_03860 [Deltaproteobacteria bacterium]|nr:MAG: hypothetical protein D6705_03860 [Deltaproteobacteria bacterium]
MTREGFHRPTWRLALLASAVFLVAFQLPFVPFSNPAIRAVSGGEGLFDVRPFYGPGDVAAALEAFGTAGRRRYLGFLAADAVFVGCYVVGLSGLVRHLGGVRGVAAPRLLAILDLAEDATIAALLLATAPPRALACLAAALTVAKHAATLSVVAVLVLLLARRRRPRATEA